jgi:enterochelin esterase-like enzyme
LKTIEYDSTSIGIKRKMVVYTPPGYAEHTRYPVLYPLHGIGDEEILPTWTAFYACICSAANNWPD